MSHCLNAGGMGRIDYETETMIVCATGDPCHPLAAGAHPPLAPMFLHTNKGRPDGRRSAHTEMVSVKDIVETLTTDGHAQSAVAVPVAFQETADCLTAAYGTKWNGNASATNGSLFAAQPVAYGIRTANTSSNGWGIQEECTHTLDCAQGVAVAFTTEQTPKFNHECALTLTKQSPTGGGQFQSVMHAMQVRRLTPEECEALQGFPRSYTAIPWRKKPASECPDGPRYRALGNSWAIPCVSWIGERIARQINSSTTIPHPAGSFKATL